MSDAAADTDPADPIRPSTRWYWVGGVLVGVGMIMQVVGQASWLTSFRDVFDDFQGPDALERIRAPGEGEVFLEEPGEQIVYVEAVGRVPRRARPLTVRIRPADGGETIPLDPIDHDATYRSVQRRGLGALQFEIDEPGRYRVEVDEAPPRTSAVAIGPEVPEFGFTGWPFGDGFTRTFIVSTIGSVFFFGGVTILIVTGVSRTREASRRRRLAMLPPPPPWAGDH